MRSRPWPRGLIVALTIAAELLVGARLFSHGFNISVSDISAYHTYGECLTGTNYFILKAACRAWNLEAACEALLVLAVSCAVWIWNEGRG